MTNQTPKQRIESLLSRAREVEAQFRESKQSLNQDKLEPNIRLDAIQYWLTQHEVLHPSRFDQIAVMQLGEILGTLETTLRLAKESETI